MSAIEKLRMTVDEFLVWAEGRPGRYELVNGMPIAMSPERARHVEAKAGAYLALRDAIKRTRLPCRAMPDGMTVRISDNRAYEPDALVYCGARVPGDELEIPNPVIVVEVLSPGTRSIDTGDKFTGYFTVDSIRHYLIVNADDKVITHHRKDEKEAITSTIHREGTICLDPPGLEVEVLAFFEDIE